MINLLPHRDLGSFDLIDINDERGGTGKLG
jgi:hypothetical protein